MSVQGQVPVAGALRTYKASYRNGASFCTSSTFKISNGAMITWAR